MRRALSVPTSTPVCALHIDLGIYPIAEAIDRKMLSYWWRIQTNEASIPYRVMETQTTYSLWVYVDLELEHPSDVYQLSTASVTTAETAVKASGNTE